MKRVTVFTVVICSLISIQAFAGMSPATRTNDVTELSQLIVSNSTRVVTDKTSTTYTIKSNDLLASNITGIMKGEIIDFSHKQFVFFDFGSDGFGIGDKVEYSWTDNMNNKCVYKFVDEMTREHGLIHWPDASHSLIKTRSPKPPSVLLHDFYLQLSKSALSDL